MSVDGLRHQASGAGSTAPGGAEEHGAPGDTAVPAVAVAARVPAEYREAYLEAFARVRADRDDTAA